MNVSAVLVFFVAAISAAQQSDDIPLATVGTITITKSEFVSRYELNPGINRRKNDPEGNKSQFMLSLIAEKLLIQKARQEGWDTDTIVTTAVQQIERMLVRDELYRTEVSQKVILSPEEIRTAIQRSSNELKVYFLFAATKETADSLHALVRKGMALEHFPPSDRMKDNWSGPDSAIARWGDVDERMENVIFTLKPNQTSKPFQLDDGWYIAKVMKRTTAIIAGESEQTVQRKKIETRLRQRKEQSRMSEYMTEALRSTATDINARLLKRTMLHLWNIAQKKYPIRTDSTMFFIDRSVITLLHEALGDSLHYPLITFPHTTWTLETAMNKIAETNLATANPSLSKIRIDIDQRLRDLIDQEYLTEIGYSRGLHQSTAVRRDLTVWRDSYLAQIVKNRIMDTITVSQHDVEELRRVFSNDTSLINDNKKAAAKTKELKAISDIDNVIGSVANSTEITFYEKNFKDVNVSSTPSMVFRILGFGGRMPAVPFVTPQIGWVNYWQNKNVILP